MPHTSSEPQKVQSAWRAGLAWAGGGNQVAANALQTDVAHS